MSTFRIGLLRICSHHHKYHLKAGQLAVIDPLASLSWSLCNSVRTNFQLPQITQQHLHSLRSFHNVGGKIERNEISAPEPIRLSKLISTHGKMSRRTAESLIKTGQVTVTGKLETDCGYKITLSDAMSGGGVVKVSGRRLLFPSLVSTSTRGDNSAIPSIKTRVWLTNKFPGEIVSENDPAGRPSLIERLSRGGVGKSRRRKKKGQIDKVHLKPVGRLDMMTEGLLLITNDGKYARDMELPKNSLHRTYRARVHGRITAGKLKAIRNGVNIDGTFYKGIRVNLELNKGNQVKGGNTNSWLRITCVEGKNRLIRRVLDHVGLKVTRLIRVSYGDYDLGTIPPGMAIEVAVKSLNSQKQKGRFANNSQIKRRFEKNKNSFVLEDKAPTVQWVRYS